MLFLSADIIAPILTKFYNKGKGMVLYSAVSSPLDRSKRFTMSRLKQKLSFQTGNCLRSPLYIRERVARMKLATIDL